MTQPQLLAKETVVHITDIFENLSKEPYLLDVDGPKPHPTLSKAVSLLIMIDSDIHIEFIFRENYVTGQYSLKSLIAGKYTDIDMITDHNLFPEVCLAIYSDSVHSLGWNEAQPIDEIITEDRMSHLLNILQHMQDRMQNLFADESLM